MGNGERSRRIALSHHKAHVIPGPNTGRLVPLFLLSEGKRELESLISDGNAEHQLLGIFAAFEPDGSSDLIAWFDACRLKG